MRSGASPSLHSGSQSRTAGQIQAEDEQEQVTGKPGNVMVGQDFFLQVVLLSNFFMSTKPGHVRGMSPLFS